MLPYGIVFFVISLNAFLNRKSTKHFSIIVFIFLILFYSLRNNVGSDWNGYEYYFDHVSSQALVGYFGFEKGYWLLNYISSQIFSSYRYMVILVGVCLGVFFWKATTHYTKNVGIVMLLSLFYIFYPSLEVIRQSITLFLFYYSLQFINNSSKKYILLNVVGFLFHRAGIVTLMFYVYHKYKISKWIIFFSLLFFGVLESYIFQVVSLIPSFAAKYIFYFHTENVENSIFSLKTLEYCVILIYCYIQSRKTTLSEYEKIGFNLVSLGLMLQLTIGQLSDIAYRMTYFTDIGVIFIYSLIYDKIKVPVFKYFYIVTLICYIFLRFYRVFPFENPSFIYSF